MEFFEMKNIIYCHIDNDGHASGYWCKRFILDNCEDDKTPEIIINPVNYGYEFNFDFINEEDHVFIVDFSFEPPVFEQLYERTKHIIWIDHHIAAIEKYNNYTGKNGENFNQIIGGVRRSGIAGCALTYLYLFDSRFRYYYDTFDDVDKDLIMSEVYKGMPRANACIADNDVWEFRLPETKDFVCGVGFLDCSTDEGCAKIDKIMNDTDEFIRICLRGKEINAYRTNELFPKIASSAIECKIKSDDPAIVNAKCIAINMPGCFNSDVFASLEEKYDVYIKFNMNRYGYTYTFYTKDYSSVNAVDVAKYFGGGGHRHAAGASSKELILEWIDEE